MPVPDPSEGNDQIVGTEPSAIEDAPPPPITTHPLGQTASALSTSPTSTVTASDRTYLTCQAYR